MSEESVKPSTCRLERKLTRANASWRSRSMKRREMLMDMRLAITLPKKAAAAAASISTPHR